jgi:peptidoglycan/LPS O-acetylase OafA/YrhL
LGLDSISAGAWYIAIDWQLYSVLAILLISFPSYQAVIWVISVLAVSSLLFFNRSGLYEAYFIYFIGAYSLGVLAYLAKCFDNQSVNRLAKIALLVIGLIIAISSFQQIWLRNFLAWFVAIALLLWGNKSYPLIESGGGSPKLKVINWRIQRSYYAFLIHFALILLANTLYIATGMQAHESGALAMALMLGVVGCSTIAENYLYRWIEVPALKLKI